MSMNPIEKRRFEIKEQLEARSLQEESLKKSKKDRDIVNADSFDHELNKQIFDELISGEYDARFRSSNTTLGGTIGILRKMVQNKEINYDLAKVIVSSLRVSMHVMLELDKASKIDKKKHKSDNPIEEEPLFDGFLGN